MPSRRAWNSTLIVTACGVMDTSIGLRQDGYRLFREPPVDQPQAVLATARAGAAYTSVVPH